MTISEAATCVANPSFFADSVAQKDPELFKAIEQELDRQQNQIELIASENIVSKAVLEAQGSVLTNKYAEGYPGRRYYGGCEFVDVAEELAIARAKELFGCAYVNVQPNSGSQANQGAILPRCMWLCTPKENDPAQGRSLGFTRVRSAGAMICPCMRNSSNSPNCAGATPFHSYP